MATKKDPHQFSDFVENFSVEIVDLALRAIINSFEIHAINSWIKKKIETSFIKSKALFALAKLKYKKSYFIFIIIIKGSSGPCKSYFQ